MKQYTAEELEYLGCSTQHIINLVEGRTMWIMSEKTPELPEGYRELSGGKGSSVLVYYNHIVAVVSNEGRLETHTTEAHFPALAIWLQRRASK